METIGLLALGIVAVAIGSFIGNFLTIVLLD